MSKPYPKRGGYHDRSRGGSHVAPEKKADTPAKDDEPAQPRVAQPPPVVHQDLDEPLVNVNRAPPPSAPRPPTEAEAREIERQRVSSRNAGRGGYSGSQGGRGGNQEGHQGQHTHHEGGDHGRGRGVGRAPRGGRDDHPAAVEIAVPEDPNAGAQPLPPPPERPIIPYHRGSRPNIEEGMRSGKVVVGVLKVMKWTTGIAWARVPGLGVDVEIHGIDARGDALPDDIVAVELSPEESWEERGGSNNAATVDGEIDESAYKAYGFNKKGAKATLPDGREIMHVVDDSKLAVSRAKSDPCTAVYEAAEAEVPKPLAGTKKPRGIVVAVMERRFNHFHPCRFIEQAAPGQALKIQPNRFYRFRAYNDKYPYLAVYGKDIPTHLHDKMADILPLVEIMSGTDNVPEKRVEDRYPRGRVVMSLGLAGTADTESKAIAAANHVKDAEFTDEVLECVFQEFKVPGIEKLKEMNRRDLREEEFVCTIDPATARDLDDALSITKTPGGYRVGVHIADVSHFVPIETPLDLEARDRCTSTYFVERVIPMLPRKLCEDYCSLNAGEDKFAFTAIFHMDNNAQITSEWFGQSVIRNRCRMAYEDAQKIIEGDTTGETLNIHEEELKEGKTHGELAKQVVKSVQMLFEVAQKLRDARYAAGALSLNKSKLKFEFDDMNSRVAPKGFSLEKSKEANWMVEQFMLLANVRVAEKIVEFLPECAMLRKHEPPQRKKLTDLAKTGAKYGFKISIKNSKGLNDSLQSYKDDPRSDALRLMATYCMSLAKYCSSGDDGEDVNCAHYALATPCYTHFTSPIRRYCDLVVHRQLLLALEIERAVKKNGAKNAADAQLDLSVMQYKHYYMSHFDVQAIADVANQRKENSRKCSDQSLQFFFCQYLEAIRLRSQVDASLHPYQRTTATIVRMKEETFTLYAAQVACDCEIYYNSKTQVWAEDCSYSKEDGAFTINWGQGPSGEVVKEPAGLFFTCVVELRVSRATGLLKLEMVVQPPWKRGEATVVAEIPKEL